MLIDYDKARFIYASTPDWHGSFLPYLFAYSAFYIEEAIYGKRTVIVVGIMYKEVHTMYYLFSESFCTNVVKLLLYIVDCQKQLPMYHKR